MKDIGNVFILGDSYSTFEGFIDKGCITWYINKSTENTDVTSVNETWWYQLIENTASKLVLNSSYSGTTICHTGYNGSDCSKFKSFPARLRNLENEGFFEKNIIDTFFIFGGTNDTWANSPIGKIKYGKKNEEDLFYVIPAFCHLIEKAMKLCPKARIITVANDILKPEIINCFETVSANFGTELIKLNNIDKQSGHPNVSGMKQIFEQILEKL